MRFFSSSAGLVVLTLAGYAGFGRLGPTSNPAPAGSIEAISGVFSRTQNLRAGVGVRSATHARRPGIPAAFHAEEATRKAPKQTTFAYCDELELWSLDGPQGRRFFADETKRTPAGHFMASGSTIDAEYRTGTYGGTAYRRATKLNPDGSGSETASGKHPIFGRYALKGDWEKGNFGTWVQHWDGPEGNWETETYQNLPGGKSVLKVASSGNVAMELHFATDLSGQGTVTDCRSGSKGKIEWDSAGDGKIAWENGATLQFEDWSF